MKKYRRILILCSMILLFLGIMKITKVEASESDFEIYDGNLISYHGTNTEVTIPDKVTNIECDAFTECPNVEKINIPKSIKYLVADAFEGTKWYDNLKKTQEYIVINNIFMSYNGNGSTVKIPEGVKLIAAGACMENTNINEVIIPDSVEGICSGAFCGCIHLSKVNFPDSIKYLDHTAFKNTSVNEVLLGANIEGIGADVFSGFFAGSGTPVGQTPKVGTGTNVVVFKGLPKNTWYGTTRDSGMYAEAFWGVPFIIVPKDADIVDSILGGSGYGTGKYLNENGETGIGGESENLCELIREASDTEDGELKLIRHAGSSYTSLPSSVTICGKKYQIKSINSNVINNDPEYFGISDFNFLKFVDISSGYEIIEDKAFYGLKNLKYVVIPKTVTTIASDAFNGCNKLTIIGYKNSYAQEYAKKYNIKFKVLNTKTLLDAIEVKSKLSIHKNDDVNVRMPIPTGLIKVNDFTGSANEIKVNYKSNNKKVASIDSDGYIDANAKGKAVITITAKLSDGTTKAFKIKVTVKTN